MKENNIKKKGFTLIELLITIGVLALISLIGIVTVIEVTKKSKEQSANLTIKNIKTASVDYITEFKKDNKYWYSIDTNQDVEYACVTIGQLINKGSLKDNVLNIKYNDNTITKETSIMLKRNKYTLVLLEEDLEFNNTNCLDDGDINVSFTVDGTVGENNYYISSPKVTLSIVNDSQIDKEETNYKLINNTNTKTTKYQDNTYIIEEEGKNINLCLDVYTNKGNNKSFCIKKDNEEKLKIDKTPPTEPKLLLNKNNEYYLLSNGSSDNLTNDTDIRYYIDNVPSNGSYTKVLEETLTNKEIKVYTKDEAGNKSNTITKLLEITSSLTTNITTTTKYYCKEKDTYYDNLEDAKSNCTKIEEGNYKVETEYCCSLNNKCSKSSSLKCEKKGSTTPVYSCPSGYSFKTSGMCVKTKSVSESEKYNLNCSGNTTYGWSSGKTESGLNSCSSSAGKCSNSSHTGNTKVTCSSYASHDSYKTESACTRKCGNACYSSDAGGTSKKWYCDAKKWKKTTYTCQAKTGSKTYGVGSMYDKTSASCSGTLTQTNYVDGCAKSEGKTCTSSSKCNRTTYYTCTDSANATVSGYQCDLDGKTYSSKYSCKRNGSITTSKSYYCDGVEYSSSSSAKEACNKTVTGDVTNKEAYTCSLTNTTSNDKNTEINNCTNYCAKGTYYNNKCYSLT